MRLNPFASNSPKLAHAHCDVPCGIYDPVEAQNAALSVVRFLDLLAEYDGAELGLQEYARVARLVEQKESHATAVKEAIVVIWGDYFNAEHFEDDPTLHTLTHTILRAASRCKQGVDPALGRTLVDLVNQFAEAFWASKGVATETVEVPYKPNLKIVRAAL